MKKISQEYTHIVHPFEPLYNADSKILILGSLPSVKSREQGFFYGHPQNRFWRVLAGVLKQDVPITIAEKRAFLLRHHIAVWDVIYSCDIQGSSDSSIKNVIPTDLTRILAAADIKHIYCNGKTSGRLYHKFQEQLLCRPAVVLPSTSPANAAFSLEKLIAEWSIILSSADVCEN